MTYCVDTAGQRDVKNQKGVGSDVRNNLFWRIKVCYQVKSNDQKTKTTLESGMIVTSYPEKKMF